MKAYLALHHLELFGSRYDQDISEIRADGGKLLTNKFLRHAGGIGIGVMFPPRALDAMG